MAFDVIQTRRKNDLIRTILGFQKYEGPPDKRFPLLTLGRGDMEKSPAGIGGLVAILKVDPYHRITVKYCALKKFRFSRTHPKIDVISTAIRSNPNLGECIAVDEDGWQFQKEGVIVFPHWVLKDDDSIDFENTAREIIQDVRNEISGVISPWVTMHNLLLMEGAPQTESRTLQNLVDHFASCNESSLQWFYVQVDKEEKTVVRKKEGVLYGEAGKKMRLVQFLPQAGLLVFKMPSCKVWSGQGQPQIRVPGRVYVCYVEPHKSDPSWYKAKTLLQWDHSPRVYSDPKK